MLKVLIPSDNRDWVVHWVNSYVRAGCEVVTGTYNVDLRSAKFDLVHFLWPEEFSQWKSPSNARLAHLKEQVHWWASRCHTIATVSNFYPHGYEYDLAFKELYNAFYERCSLTLHFSPTSFKMVREEFIGSRHDRHLIVDQLNYGDLLKIQNGRGSCRSELGLADQDFVVLVLGSLRSWAEVQLITRAFSRCKVKNKRLLMAGRYQATGSLLQRKCRQLTWKIWLWRHDAVTAQGYIPDEDLYRYLDSADVAIVPRLVDLTSGIPALAMTFGTMVIAPTHGAYPDYLAGTSNLLYESGDASSLAAALEKAACIDRKPIFEHNQELARQWTGDKIVSKCLKALKIERESAPL